MISCACCRADIPAPAIKTLAGDFVAPWGLCRRCWRLVSPDRRKVLRRARLEYRALPFMEASIVFYRAWELALMEAQARDAWRGAA